MRSGAFRFVKAQAVLLATGGGPTMYRYHTPSGDKSMDGLAMALRLGLPLRDMEMVQFHPTGLLAGPDTRMTGTVLEEGLRGAGGHLLNGAMHRFMADYDPEARARHARCRQPRHLCGDEGRPDHAERRASISKWRISARPRWPRNSRAWSTAAAIAASISPADWSKWCRRHTILWAGWSVTWIRRPNASGFLSPERMQAACTAPTGSAATVSPIRPSSAALPAT